MYGQYTVWPDIFLDRDFTDILAIKYSLKPTLDSKVLETTGQ